MKGTHADERFRLKVLRLGPETILRSDRTYKVTSNVGT